MSVSLLSASALLLVLSASGAAGAQLDEGCVIPATGPVGQCPAPPFDERGNSGLTPESCVVPAVYLGGPPSGGCSLEPFDPLDPKWCVQPVVHGGEPAVEACPPKLPSG